VRARRIVGGITSSPCAREGHDPDVVPPLPRGEILHRDVPGGLFRNLSGREVRGQPDPRPLESRGEGSEIDIDSTIFRPATFIEMSLRNLNSALLIGCLLVIMVLAFFLNDWRTALISALAIPTSLIIAALILNYRGGTINTMVLAGLIIASHYVSAGQTRGETPAHRRGFAV